MEIRWEKPYPWNDPRGEDFTVKGYKARYTLFDTAVCPQNETYHSWRTDALGTLSWNDLGEIFLAMDGEGLNDYTSRVQQMMIYDKLYRVEIGRYQNLDSRDQNYLAGYSHWQRSSVWSKPTSDDPDYLMGWEDAKGA